MLPCRSSVQSTARAGGAVVAWGSRDGRPSTRAVKGPLSDMVAARPSRRCGLTCSSRVSMSSVWLSQIARPLQRPALLRGLSANQTSKRVASRRLGACGWRLSSSSSRRTGRRRSFQRPGAALSSSTLAAMGASRAVLRMSAVPLRRVCGAPGSSAAKSSADVRAVSVPSGQAASGRSWPARSSAGAAWPPRDTPRSVAVTSSCSSPPAACSTAAQSGAAALDSGVTVSCATTGSGAVLPMLTRPVAALPSQRSDRLSMLWRPPALPSRRTSRSTTSRIGSRPFNCSSSTRICASCTRARKRSWSMRSGWPPGTVITTTRRALTTPPCRSSQSSPSGSHFQRRPWACSCSMSTRLPAPHFTCRRSARSVSPSRAPCRPVTCTPGTRASNQRAPASSISTQRPASTAVRATNASKPSTSHKGSKSRSAADTGRAGATGAAGAGGPGEAGRAGVGSMASRT